MNESAKTDAVQTDLPSPKPNHRKRLALRFGVLVAAVSVLGAAYRFTRPPELVWWTSQPTPPTGARIRLQIPAGWELQPGYPIQHTAASIHVYVVSPRDHRPAPLRWLIPKAKDGDIGMSVPDVRDGKNRWGSDRCSISPWSNMKRVSVVKMVPAAKMAVQMDYYRTEPAFTRTYRQICKSITIEK